MKQLNEKELVLTLRNISDRSFPNKEFVSELNKKLIGYIDDSEINYWDIDAINGYKNVQVITAGKGTPILLLHDVGVIPELYLNTINYLKRDHLVIAPALPGHGRTDCNDKPNDPKEMYCEFILEILNYFQIEDKVKIIGHSFGGTIGIIFASMYPELTESLVLVSSATAPFSLNILQQFRSYLDYFTFNRDLPFKLISSFIKNMKSILKTYRLMFSINLRQELEKLSINTIILWGEKDNLVPRHQAMQIKEIVKDSTLFFIKNRHHNWLFDSPENVNLI